MANFSEFFGKSCHDNLKYRYGSQIKLKLGKDHLSKDQYKNFNPNLSIEELMTLFFHAFWRSSTHLQTLPNRVTKMQVVDSLLASEKGN